MPKTPKKKKRSLRKVKAGDRRPGHPVPGLIGPLLEFDLVAETEQLREEEAWKTTSRNAKTLVKYPDLRVVLIAMKSGTRMKGHRADGSISIQTLTGKLLLHLPDQAVELPAGSLLTLERALSHDVEALKGSSFLLTISWPRGV